MRAYPESVYATGGFGEKTVSVPRAASTARKMFAFLGPGYMVAVGYMDPGNWATDLAGGSRFGYTLLSVVLLSNLCAILLQSLALKLGIASGRDLAQACREQFSRRSGIALWVLAELAIVACDLAEVIGSAIALNLLFGLPLLVGICATSLDVLIILFLANRGVRYLEAFVIALTITIGICFSINLILAHPDITAVVNGFIPNPEIVMNSDMLYIAVGIVGATVMPHNLYLHSALVKTRQIGPDTESKREAVRFATIDSTIALLFAFFINASIVILAASVFNASGHNDVAEIGDAYQLLVPILGTSMAATLFAVALLASGQNSTITGTLAGQIVMEGFLNLRLSPWLRRLITRLLAIVPAAVVTAFAGEKGMASLLILSQVVLSVQLSFAVVPLVKFTSDRNIMGELVNGRLLQVSAWGIACAIIALNGWMLFATFQLGLS